MPKVDLSRAEKFLKFITADTRDRLRQSVVGMQQHDTPDTRRLGLKLKSPELKLLASKAEQLLRVESLRTPYVQVNVKEIRADLEQLLDVEVTRDDITSYARSRRAWVLDQFSFDRLDWLWDFTWSYVLWPADKFKPAHMQLYGGIRGPKPADLHRVPYQAVLTWVRKDIIKERRKSIWYAAKRGDLEKLLELGLTLELAQQAVTKAADLQKNGSQQSDPLE